MYERYNSPWSSSPLLASLMLCVCISFESASSMRINSASSRFSNATGYPNVRSRFSCALVSDFIAGLFRCPSALAHLLARGAWSRGEDCCINEQAHEASVPCVNMSFRRMSRGFSLCSAANSDCEKTVFAAVQPGSLHLGDFFANHRLVDRRLPEFPSKRIQPSGSRVTALVRLKPSRLRPSLRLIC